MRCRHLIEKYYETHKLRYYEWENDLKPLVLIHAQGVDALSFENVVKLLSRKFHVYSVDCYGHGGSSHDKYLYNVKSVGDAVTDFIKDVIREKVWMVGHSSGGLIAGYVAAFSGSCDRLILEDPPFFASEGERRKQTFNYVDLSTLCHNYNLMTEKDDFVLYYFENQYSWNFFPEKSRKKIKSKMVADAKAYRAKHPDKNLKVMFWPKSALAGFKGMNNYDPEFGETFYDNTFHCDIPHEEILRNIKCKTVFLKAKTNYSPDGILLAALDEDDVNRVAELIDDCEIVRFDCGHGIHVEKPRKFIKSIKNMLK